MLTGKFLQIRKVFFGPEYLGIIWLIQKRSRWSEASSDELEYPWMVCKVSGQSEKCRDCLKKFRILLSLVLVLLFYARLWQILQCHGLCALCGKFLCGKFCCLETFSIFWLWESCQQRSFYSSCCQCKLACGDNKLVIVAVNELLKTRWSCQYW